MCVRVLSEEVKDLFAVMLSGSDDELREVKSMRDTLKDQKDTSTVTSDRQRSQKIHSRPSCAREIHILSQTAPKGL